MHCPYCGHSESKVVDSRESVDGVRRRRECLKCERRYTTYERVQTDVLQIAKRDGRREEFSRDKLRASLLKACAKRPLPTGRIDKIVQEISADLAELSRSEVQSGVIGEMVMDRLKTLDWVAYIRFASVYRDFRDIETFKQEIDALLEPEPPGGEASEQLSLLEEEELSQTPRRRRARRREGRV